ncbi:MAG: undecaprenyl-diphosphatase [Parcubacteria group bacterium Gr01-1014_56]|nr:MAG: undecaprenyl-diphosphatase [Parcubacteria group bacterium Gr01-1014_56]
MSIFDALLLGVVEGVTEFLPVSSTGHLILLSTALGLGQTDFQKSFEIIIQLGAIAAVFCLYWKSFLDVEILKRLLVAFIPTGIIGLMLYSVIKTYLIGNNAVVLWALVLGGVALIVFEYLHTESESAVSSSTQISFKQSALIGLFQAIAIVPGVSRSGATILGGLLVGLKRTTIVEFSFLLAVPTMLAAVGFDLFKNISSFSNSDFTVLAVGFVAAFVVALLAIKFLLQFVRTHTFVPFGIYRILAALVFWFMIF